MSIYIVVLRCGLKSKKKSTKAFTLEARGVDRDGTGGHVSQYLARDTLTSVPRLFQESSQVVFIPLVTIK